MPGQVQDSTKDTLASVLEGAQNWLTYDTRFPSAVGGIYGASDTEKDSSAGGLPCKRQLHVLPTPAWVPDSYIRSRKRNLYLQMLNSKAVDGEGTLEFYKEAPGGLTGMLQNLGSSAMTLVSNQVGALANTAQGVAEGVANMLGKTTYDDVSVTDPFLENQPYAKIYGINPIPTLAENLEIVKQAWNIIKSVINTDNGFKDFKNNMEKALLKAISKILSPSGEQLSINSWKDLWEKISKNDSREHSLIERLMVNCTPGTYMQFVKVPYQSPEPTMFSCQGTWSGGFTGSTGDEFGTAVSKFTGLQIGSMKRMEWTPEGIVRQTPMAIKFTMYNDTIDHLIANFFFMIGFTAGAKATTDTIFLRAPYLYDVEFPGGGRFRLCTCDCSFTPVGKMRRLSRWMLLDIAMASPWGFGNIMKLEKDMYFPDAWEVELNFMSKLPDTWNFMSSYFFAKDDERPKLGASIHSVLGTFMGSFADELNKAESGGGSQS